MSSITTKFMLVVSSAFALVGCGQREDVSDQSTIDIVDQERVPINVPETRKRNGTLFNNVCDEKKDAYKVCHVFSVVNDNEVVSKGEITVSKWIANEHNLPSLMVEDGLFIFNKASSVNDRVAKLQVVNQVEDTQLNVACEYGNLMLEISPSDISREYYITSKHCNIYINGLEAFEDRLFFEGVSKSYIELSVVENSGLPLSESSEVDDGYESGFSTVTFDNIKTSAFQLNFSRKKDEDNGLDEEYKTQYYDFNHNVIYSFLGEVNNSDFICNNCVLGVDGDELGDAVSLVATNSEAKVSVNGVGNSFNFSLFYGFANFNMLVMGNNANIFIQDGFSYMDISTVGDMFNLSVSGISPNQVDLYSELSHVDSILNTELDDHLSWPAAVDFDFSEVGEGLSINAQGIVVLGGDVNFPLRNALIETFGVLSADVSIGDGTQVFGDIINLSGDIIGRGINIKANDVLNIDSAVEVEGIITSGQSLYLAPNSTVSGNTYLQASYCISSDSSSVSDTPYYDTPFLAIGGDNDFSGGFKRTVDDMKDDFVYSQAIGGIELMMDQSLGIETVEDATEYMRHCYKQGAEFQNLAYKFPYLNFGS